MALIVADKKDVAQVAAPGEVRSAVVEMNSSLMDMLSTVYAYILMSAIREAIQNGCDAVKRKGKGLSFAEGVMVSLPTAENPVITVRDSGDGMSREFMETNYLALGRSTKAGDNGAAGGLGIGRWAAYGYIGEASVRTCYAGDMVERTYFMYKSDKGVPATQLAAEVAGVRAGTQVSFPVRESDLQEAYLAVRWLRDLMQLTMGDAFSVDKPGLLDNGVHLPEFSGHVLDLGAEDAELEGVRVFMMMGSALQYSRTTLADGSLVVLTNQEAGIGGLPFHVRAITGLASPFAHGCVIELPMRLGVPFMPSREEVKYSDEMTALMHKVDVAANKALLRRAAELYEAPALQDQFKLTTLLGTGAENAVPMTWASRLNMGAWQSGVVERLKELLGGTFWNGKAGLRIPRSEAYSDLTVRSARMDRDVLSTVNGIYSQMYINLGKAVSESLVAQRTSLPILIADDLKTGGVSRVRLLVRSNSLNLNAKQLLIVISAKSPAEAVAAAEAMNASYGNPFQVLKTSELPEVPKVVVGDSLSLAAAKGLTYHCFVKNKQVMEPGALLAPTEPRQAYLVKQGGVVHGLKAGMQLSDLVSGYRAPIRHLSEFTGLNRVYLLAPKEAAELERLKTELAGMEPDEMSDEEAQLSQKLAQWVPYFELVQQAAESPKIVAAREGKLLTKVTGSVHLHHLVTMLARAPRFCLLGTKVDKALSPYVDLANGSVLAHSYMSASTLWDQKVAEVLRSLADLTRIIDLEQLPEAQQQCFADMENATEWGYINYDKIYESLANQFPLLRSSVTALTPEGQEHFCKALAHLHP